MNDEQLYADYTWEPGFIGHKTLNDFPALATHLDGRIDTWMLTRGYTL